MNTINHNTRWKETIYKKNENNNIYNIAFVPNIKLISKNLIYIKHYSVIQTIN